jgi:zinc transporter 5/7
MFLCINLMYMVVELVYGYWTNSLGLMSDAGSLASLRVSLSLSLSLFLSDSLCRHRFRSHLVRSGHMFFDCMALGIGLYASIMTKWKPHPLYSFGCAFVLSLSLGLC